MTGDSTFKPESTRSKGIRAAQEARVALGLELAMMHAQHGVPMEFTVIAEFCGVSKSAVQLMEQSALKRLRHPSRMEVLHEAFHGEVADV